MVTLIITTQHTQEMCPDVACLGVYSENALIYHCLYISITCLYLSSISNCFSSTGNSNIPSNSGTCRCILLPKIIELINSDICTLFYANDTSC